MGGVKDIPKFNGYRAKFEAFMVSWQSHNIRSKVGDISNITRHPDCPVMDRHEPKGSNKAMNKKVKKLLK